ncbi:MAG: RNA methyltransferase [Deltaproteobacteria bacterium]|nr:RNA methyltransferase [Deltaproteobacteria bacterium]
MKSGGRSGPVAVALVHYPIYNRNRERVTTSVTTVDVHDIARTARTYAVEPFYVVTPVQAQREMVGRIVDHWATEGRRRDHPRAEAISKVRLVPSLEGAVSDFIAEYGVEPLTVVTGASMKSDIIPFEKVREIMATMNEKGLLLVFGTGWGLTADLAGAADIRLEPIKGVDGFNHLPVRAAVAIVLDRLIGPSL